MSQEERYLSGRPGRTAQQYRRLNTLVRTRGETAWNVFVYSSGYITTIALIEVSIAMALLGLAPNPAPVIVGLVTFAVYTNDRIADAETDALADPAQSAFVQRHEDVLFVAAAGAYGLAVMLAVTGGPVALSLTLLPGAFWLLYATNWLSGLTARLRRLKELLVVNTAVVALAWAVTVTFLPLAFADEPLSPAAGLVFGYFFLRDFTHTEIPNIPDRAGDAAIGVATLPVVYGLAGTRRALYLVQGLTVLLVGGAVVTGDVAPAVGIALGIALCYALVVTGLIGRCDRERLVPKLAEGEYPLTFVALLTVLPL